MTFQLQLFQIPGFTAGADLSGDQFKFVKHDATAKQVILCTAVTDIPLGVLQNDPKLGEFAEIMTMGITKVQSDAALNIGDLIGTSADAQADAKVPGTDTTNFVVGRVLTATSAAGELASALINTATPFRAA